MYIALSSWGGGGGGGNPTPHGHGPDFNVCTKYLGSVSLIIKLKRHNSCRNMSNKLHKRFSYLFLLSNNYSH